MKTIAVIPARRGSKRFPGKNTVLFLGRPLVAHAIETAIESGVFSEIYVTTDDPEVAKIAAEYGVRTIARPAALCEDNVVLDQVVVHLLAALDAEGCGRDAACLMTPTAPLRTADDVRGAVGLLRENEADFVSTVVEYEHNPLYAMRMRSGVLEPAFMQDVFTRDRNDLPTLYRPVAVARAGRWEAIAMHRTTFGPGMLPFVIPQDHAVDIDNPVDLELAELLFRQRERNTT